MHRKTFIKQSLAAMVMTSLVDIKKLGSLFNEEDQTMPVLFIGHGSPMNAIEENEFTLGWKSMAATLPKPSAILCISAHWLTKGSYVSTALHPETIHDFGGFPDELFAVQYPAKGDPALAKEITQTITHPVILADPSWGLDHGAWSIAKPMFPNADIPMFQMSIDFYQPPSYHYELGKQLASLRKKGVLIIGSGNMVHHLGMINFNKPETGEDWAIELDALFKKKILDGNHQDLIAYESLHKSIKLAVPTPDHYYPLLYTLGLQNEKDTITLFNDKTIYGSLSMTSVKIG